MGSLKWLRFPLFTTFGLLAIPLITMNFTDEVQWNIGDFVIAGILIFTVLSALRYVRTKYDSNNKSRTKWILIIAVLFILLWMEMAVGLFNSPLAGS